MRLAMRPAPAAADAARPDTPPPPRGLLLGATASGTIAHRAPAAVQREIAARGCGLREGVRES
eukprot:1532587-Prymnesium_polylepis.1